ncbi:MAG TPA: hypothetical protein VFE24_13480 [Pirellulales bacterium]|jgi:hypothetical protein|nr:hypothetical protein [Pirellulales bacterium]
MLDLPSSTFRRRLGGAHAGVSLLAAVGLILLVGDVICNPRALQVAEYARPVLLLEMAGGLYLAFFCVIHARWGSLLRRERHLAPGVKVSIGTAHAVILIAVMLVLGRQFDSRILIAGLELPLTVWFTLAAVGMILSFAELGYDRWRGQPFAEQRRGATLAGWKHQIPPLIVAGLLATAIWYLESRPLPGLPRMHPQFIAPADGSDHG